jgi:hypothetical protein
VKKLLSWALMACAAAFLLNMAAMYLLEVKWVLLAVALLALGVILYIRFKRYSSSNKY